LTLREAVSLILSHFKKRVMEQVRAVALIVVYLVLFQTLVLGIPLVNATLIGFGLLLVVLGLAFFMEGLLIGLMPLGETLGIKLPRRAGLPLILAFAFILGLGATFAEPAIGVLRTAGASIRAWEAPLLFLLLNRNADLLVQAIGVGVGCAVAIGMLRILFGWSLKPILYLSVLPLVGLTAIAHLDPNLRAILGLAWDCGAVTTGPVTVPLVIALGIGISRMAREETEADGGFGVVTLASLLPVVAILVVGLFLLNDVPRPMPAEEFLRPENRSAALALFKNESDLIRHARQHAPIEAAAAFADHPSPESSPAMTGAPTASGRLAFLTRHLQTALRAILPLAALLLVVLLLLRERLPLADEIVLGLVFAVFGLAVFSGGIELGLDRIGRQVGANLPASFVAIDLPQRETIIDGFDPAAVQTALEPDGRVRHFFHLHHGRHFEPVPFQAEHFDEETRRYRHIPTRGPLFGAAESGVTGLFVVILFAFVMGYGATLAEPALHALGLAVEEISVGTFKKTLLIQSVAVGVGSGISLGLARIIWEIPLAWVLVPGYLLLLVMTRLSTEEFVNIGWDSAGVTTGPITVPLVLAMGLGIGGQIGVVEGFGILATASLCPIISVLAVGLSARHRETGAHIERVAVRGDAS
jgi:hypothetical protein